MTLICIPVQAPNHAALLDKIASACAAAPDCIELRLDHLQETPKLARLLAACTIPAIVTCRAQREGGAFAGTEGERLSILQEAINQGAPYVDAESDCIEKLTLRGGTKIIASTHDFHKTPDDLIARATEMAKLPCDIVKIATMATSLHDNIKMQKAIRACPKPMIGLCMGEYGELSRILAPRLGSLLTFASLDHGEKSAPGQPCMTELIDLYRIKQINESTQLYGVVGNPIAHSMSPQIHNTAFAEIDINAVYLRLRVEDFGVFLKDVSEPLGFRGLSVTIPHKDAALAAANEVDPLAARIGAVNTLTRTETGWHGANTDCEAALDAIRDAADRKSLSLKNAAALVLGAGGTGRALCAGLADAGCRLSIANRTRSKAEALASEFGANVYDLANVHNHDFTVVANTTAVGMTPNTDASPVDAAIFHSQMVAFDAVYNPPRTRFLQDATQAGAAIADGIAMFTGQAARQFTRWTNQPAPLGPMRRVVLARFGITE